jgi:carbon storage regulator CsrA
MNNLILTRRKGEAVVIYNEHGILVKVVVTSLGPKQTKLAFEANSEIKIDREEIYKAKK